MTRHTAWLCVGTFRKNAEPQIGYVSSCQESGYQDSCYPVTKHLQLLLLAV